MRMMLALALLLTVAVSAAGEDDAGAGPEEYVVVAAEPLRSLTTVSLGEETWILHLGPAWFWEDQDFNFEIGDTLNIFGEAILEEDGGRQLYPYKLIRGDREIILANEAGIPLWARGFRGVDGRDRRGRSGHERGDGRNGQGRRWGR